MAETLTSRENLAGKHSDVAIIMGSPLDKDGSGAYYFPLFEDHVDGLLIDGDLKARAISDIYKNRLANIVLVTGGMQDGVVSRAQYLMQHTIQRYQVPQSFMVPLTSAPHTIGNLETAGRYLDDHSELLPNGSISIWTIWSHLLRTEAFAVQNESLAKYLLCMQIAPVEDLLIETGSVNASTIEEYHKSQATIERLRMEGEGIKAIINGTYQARST